jgi:hypothetical protein
MFHQLADLRHALSLHSRVKEQRSKQTTILGNASTALPGLQILGLADGPGAHNDIVRQGKG